MNYFNSRRWSQGSTQVDRWMIPSGVHPMLLRARCPPNRRGGKGKENVCQILREWMVLFCTYKLSGTFSTLCNAPKYKQKQKCVPAVPHHWAQTYGGIHPHPQSTENSWLGPTTASTIPINHPKYGLMSKKSLINGLQWLLPWHSRVRHAHVKSEERSKFRTSTPSGLLI